MRIHRQILVLALTVAVPLTAVAVEQVRGKQAARVSVGEFAAMLAASAAADRSAGPAVDSLVKSGVPLGDLKAPLTEQKLAEILGYYGLSARTSSPDRQVSQGKAEAAALLVGTSSVKGPMIGKGDAKLSPRPQTLDDCLALQNHGQCVGCCKALGGTARTCSNTCFEINKGSSSEPIP